MSKPLEIPAVPRGRVAVRAADRSERAWAYLMLAPSFVLFAAFLLVPIGATLALSLAEWNLITPARFAGLENYRALLSDARLGQVVANTLGFTFWTVVAKIGLGLVLAQVVWKLKPRFVVGLVESALFFPVILPMSVVTMVWGMLLNTDGGAVNGLLVSLGLARVPWLTDAGWALRSIMLLDVWKGVGFFFIVYLVALRNVPRELYEAAEMDGAGPLAVWRRITLPSISPTTLFLTVIAVIGSLQVFDQAYILTRGGPGDATKSLVYYLWQNAFQLLNMGYGATLALLLFAGILLVTLLQFALSRRWVSYDQ